jgi:multidrug efflux pump
VALTELFETLQVYLGSAYVNDFNRFGRTWQVIAQADADFRTDAEDIGRLRTRNARGEMVPIASMVRIDQTFGPDPVLRYNGHPAADLMGEADPRRLSSARRWRWWRPSRRSVLPAGIGLRVDRSQLPAGEPGQRGGDRRGARRAAGLPRARSAL